MIVIKRGGFGHKSDLWEAKMKCKFACIAVAFLVISIVGGRAETKAAAQNEQAAVMNPSELVGKWGGKRVSDKAYPVDMEISGEDLKGKMTYYRVSHRGRSTGTEFDTFTARIESDELRIDATSTVRLKLYKGDGGQIQLKGTFQRGKAQGEMVLEKR
jgi:hypothetical protein